MGGTTRVGLWNEQHPTHGGTQYPHNLHHKPVAGCHITMQVTGRNSYDVKCVVLAVKDCVALKVKKHLYGYISLESIRSINKPYMIFPTERLQ